MPADPSRERAREIALSLGGYQCTHDNNCGDVGGRQSWCWECIADAYTAALAEARREERLKLARIVCHGCAQNDPIDFMGKLVHFLPLEPYPMECRASAIRALEGDDGR